MARKSTFDRQCQWLYNFLQRPSSVVAWAYHWTVAIVILLGLLFFALATVTELPELHKRSELALKILEIAILAILTLEFLLLVWASSCISRYRGCLGKLRYILMSFRQLDLVIIGATAVVVWTCYLPREQSHLLFLRCGMLFQILRLENRFQAWRFLRTVLRIERPHILASALLCLLALLTISYCMYFIEQSDAETNFINLPVSMYWGVITSLTIGYGDLAPTTTAGRIVTSILAIFSVTIFAIPAGILSTGVALRTYERTRVKAISKRRIPAATLIQFTWRCYAARKNYNTIQKQMQKTLSSGKLALAKSNPAYVGSQSSRLNLTLPEESFTGQTNEEEDYQKILERALRNASWFISKLKFDVARRRFRQSLQPYDIKDVLHQYAEGHAEVVHQTRDMQREVNTVHYGLDGMLEQMLAIHAQQSLTIDRLEETILVLQMLLARQHSSGA